MTRSQTYPLDKMPLEMKEEICMKLEVECITKLIALSKSWSSIVRNKIFTNLYLNQSLARPRILISLIGVQDMQHFFLSCSQEDPSSDHRTVSCNPPRQGNWYNFSPPVRGLMSCMCDNNKVMIGNPSTRQLITLPRVKTVRKDILHFFGYDPVKGEYKVLCMTVSRNPTRSRSGEAVTEEHQVFTLGAKRKKWRKIECEHLHYAHPRTQGICSNGVVYYLAWVENVRFLICFDVGSEKFSVMELPGDVEGLSNYGEKIAVTKMIIDGNIDLWVLEDASKQKWSKTTIVTSSWI
ncbi:hypothetical protein CARUB_v10015469mg, partial [Capsella rubella]